ncbi:MAG: hypothetical protein IPG66_00490 [Hydrogenophilales bacterium]|nr:hypothetical protein [Hydrogenophilales bacterium]
MNKNIFKLQRTTWLAQTRLLATLMLLGMTPSLITACDLINRTTWKEEVLLHDGNKLIVERSVVRKGRREIGQSPPIGHQRLTFVLSGDGEEITWKDPFSEELGSANFLPMMLEIHKGAVYLVANPAGCLSYNKWGRPNPPYVVLKYHRNKWVRIPLAELPGELVRPNLIISSPDEEARRVGDGIVTAKQIQKINTGYKQPENKTILRTPVVVNCEPMVHYKCGWVGTRPDGTFDREFMDRM